MNSNKVTCKFCAEFVEKHGGHFRKLKGKFKCKHRFKLDKNGDYGMILKKGVL